jgi:hypothetical protein
VVEWSRALDIRLSDWCCSVSMVWVQIPSREEKYALLYQKTFYGNVFRKLGEIEYFAKRRPRLQINMLAHSSFIHSSHYCFRL